jgi:hypothetical protein
VSLAPRLDIRQSQSLVMTPQLQQAIKLLALSNLEIEGFIAEEVERNPLLEAGAAEESPDLSDAPDRDPVPEARDERVAADERRLRHRKPSAGQRRRRRQRDGRRAVDDRRERRRRRRRGRPRSRRVRRYQPQPRGPSPRAGRSRDPPRGCVHRRAPDRSDRRDRLSHHIAARHRQPASARAISPNA